MGLGSRFLFLLLGLALLAGLLLFGFSTLPVLLVKNGRELLYEYLIFSFWLFCAWFTLYVALRDDEWQLRQDALGQWTIRLGYWMFILLTLGLIPRALALAVQVRDVALALAAFAFLGVAAACMRLGRSRARSRQPSSVEMISVSGFMRLGGRMLASGASAFTLIFGLWVVFQSALMLHARVFEDSHSIPRSADGWWIYYPVNFILVGTLLVIVGYATVLYGTKSGSFLKQLLGSRKTLGGLILLTIPLLAIDFHLGGLSWGHVLFNPVHWTLFIVIACIGVAVYRRGLWAAEDFSV